MSNSRPSSLDGSSDNSLFQQPETPDMASDRDDNAIQALKTTDHGLSTLEQVFSTHAPIFESFLLQVPTDAVFQLYHTSRYLRNLLRSYPTAWQYLSFRLLFPSGAHVRPVTAGADAQVTQRQSRPYALDQLLLHVIVPFSPSLRSLDLDNTAVSGQNLISIVLSARRESLEHVSVRGCKNVSLKYHIIPYLTMFGLQYDTDTANHLSTSPNAKPLALKSLYTYRCRHHRRRPYLTSSLLRRDSDSEPTHELVNLCHKLNIWTDTAWCTTPAGRCFRRKGYVSMRVPQGTPEVWVVFDRLWRSKNWVGATADSGEPMKRDGRLWEHDETGHLGEPLGTADGRERGEGKTIPTHLRGSHKRFVENIKCDSCLEDISERCEQCSVLMHCVGCRRTLCYSCAFDSPYPHRKPPPATEVSNESFWWPPRLTISPCAMQEPPQHPLITNAAANNNNQAAVPAQPVYPTLKFHWCCTEPIFTGGGGISIGAAGREVDRVRAAPLPRGQGWEDPEYSTNEWTRTFPKYAYGDPKRPDYTLAEGHTEMMRWLLGPSSHQPSNCPRNLCQECFDSPQWKVHCKSCSKPLCMEHDLRGLRLRICGYRDLLLEKIAIGESRPPGPGDVGTPRGRNLPVPSASVAPLRIPVLPSISVPTLGQHQAEASGSSSIPQDTSAQSPNASENAYNVPASASTSNNHTRASSPASVYFDPLPSSERWIGCQSFFCPQYRAVGDQRQRCTSVLHECTSCSVHVCQDCIQSNPPCTCTYCEANYLCPNCQPAKEQDGTCRRIEEERAKRDEKQKRDLEIFEVALERNLANEVAGFAGQFFGQLMRDHEAHTHSTEGLSGPSGTIVPSLLQLDGAINHAQAQQSSQIQLPPDEEHGQEESGSEHTEMLGEEA